MSLPLLMPSTMENVLSESYREPGKLPERLNELGRKNPFVAAMVEKAIFIARAEGDEFAAELVFGSMMGLYRCLEVQDEIDELEGH